MKNKNGQNLVFYALAFFLLVFPLHRVSSTVPSVLVMLFSFISIWKLRINIFNVIRKYPFILFSIIYFIVCVFSFFQAADFAEFMTKAKLKIFFLLFPIALFAHFQFLQTKENILSKISILGGVLSILFFMVVALFKYPSMGSNAFFYGELVSISAISPILYSMLFNIYILIVYYKVKHRVLRLSLMLFFSLFIVMLLSKIGLIFLVLLWVYFGIINFSFSRKTLYFTIFFSCFVISMFFLFKQNEMVNRRFNVTKYYFQHSFSSSVNEQFPRAIIFSSAISIIKQNPLLGVGMTNSRKELKKEFIARDFKTGIIKNYDAHNQFLETTIASGLLGMLSILFIYLFLIKDAIKRKSKQLLVFALIILLVSLVENLFEAQMGVFIFFLFSFLFYIMKTDRVEV